MKRMILIIFTSCFFFSCEVSDPTTSSENIGGCPTTAACGCSQNNKPECEDHRCCKWTVGEGCGCR